MAYVLALPMVVGLIGGILNYLFTGEAPQELKDYFFPRTNGKDEEGRPERLSLPSYLKDLYHYYQKPGQTLIGKFHPLLTSLAEMLQNHDFYGVEIRNANDPVMTQMTDELKHLLGTFEPFAVRGFRQEQERGTSLGKSALPFVGLTPAPSDINKTPAEKLMSEVLGSNDVMTKEQAEKSKRKRDLKREARRGEDISGKVGEGLEAGRLNVPDVQQVLRANWQTRLEENFKKLTLEQSLDVWERANPKERELLEPLLMAKQPLLWKLTPQQQRRVEPRLNRALGLDK
jgi:hypothetical protein